MAYLQLQVSKFVSFSRLVIWCIQVLLMYCTNHGVFWWQATFTIEFASLSLLKQCGFLYQFSAINVLSFLTNIED